jgi:thymidylate synthase
MKDFVYYGEDGYLDLLQDILLFGVDVKNERTGHVCKTIFDAKFIIPEGEHFVVTHRPLPMRLAFEEFMFFLRGETETKKLEEKGCNFWRGNTTREFLDRRGLSHLPEGNLGHAYSMQWRNAGGNWDVRSDYDKLDSSGIDQLRRLIGGLRADPTGRRHIVTLWNPVQEHLMPLTPCWHTSQYVVLPNDQGNLTLHVKLINRSLDVTFGMLFAIQQYRLFQMMLCKMLGFALGALSADITNAHIYDNQFEYVDEILDRSALNVKANISINKDLQSLDDLLSLEWKDIIISGHEVDKTPFKTPRPPMVA